MASCLRLARALLLLLVAWLLGAGCNCAPDEERPKEATPPMVDAPALDAADPNAEAPWPVDPRHVTVHHAAELADFDATVFESLDLALSEIDRVGFIDQGRSANACEGLDLVRLAKDAPRLTKLRISGCQAALQAGLGSFGNRIDELELADLTLDGVVLGRLGQLVGLKTLTLRRVRLGSDVLKPLRNLSLKSLTLAELKRDSDVSLMLDMWPRSLERVVLEGEWASHKAMLTLAKADALTELALRDTRIGNFSLNQIKPLENLRAVEFRGSTFNDNSPLYFRELPVREFTCACPRMGDAGLRSLRHSKGLRKLALIDTQVTGSGFVDIEELAGLESLVLRGLDPGPDGFEAFAAFTKLRHLELDGTLERPTLENLSKLRSLQELRLGYRDLDDRATAELSSLTALRQLDLSRTRVSDDGLAALASLVALEELELHHTRVTNRGLAHIAGLSALVRLELDHTDVVDAGVAHLAGLQNLVELRLDSTLVTDASVDHLLELTSLSRLNVGNTVMTKAGVARLTGLPKLTALGVYGIRER